MSGKRPRALLVNGGGIQQAELEILEQMFDVTAFDESGEFFDLVCGTDGDLRSHAEGLAYVSDFLRQNAVFNFLLIQVSDLPNTCGGDLDELRRYLETHLLGTVLLVETALQLLKPLSIVFLFSPPSTGFDSQDSASEIFLKAYFRAHQLSDSFEVHFSRLDKINSVIDLACVS